jgi:pSer/pThr/pTyr-binding forkhead associated (FHA) protein
MIECQFCQTSHVINTIFCGECGQYLLGETDRETVPLDTPEISWKGGTSHNYSIASSSPSDIKLLTLRLKMGLGKREVEIPLNKIINLGRLDPASNVFPEIDLTPDDDLTKSVSRRHAAIFKQGGAIVVEDLASINGTFINGKRLAPYLPEALRDGDILQLGRLLIEVKIQIS